MKKTVSILAVLVMSIGLFSCEADNNLEETQSLYENLDTDATDNDQVDDDGRE
ncbi:hypothetical protein WIW50_13540 [Flavobacteriaceae bacterium 3-367]|uniref:hypothetical protein n=1 Tax=Eudoraea algarum TaxID=3417568 RepID=UPI00326CCB0D